MTFGEKLQKLRREKGLSQDQLAEKLNVSRQAISKWERGEALPDTDKIVGLSELLSVSTDYLLKEQPLIEKRQEAPAEHGFFVQLGHLFRTRGYFLGYVLALWGVYDLIKALSVWAAWNAMTGLAGQTADFSPELQNFFNSPLTTLRFISILGGVKIAAGLTGAILGRRYCRKGAQK